MDFLIKKLKVKEIDHIFSFYLKKQAPVGSLLSDYLIYIFVAFFEILSKTFRSNPNLHIASQSHRKSENKI